MSDKFSISPDKQKFVVYVFLTLVTLAVFWQTNRYESINFDDPVYLNEYFQIREGFTLDAVRWAFSTTAADFWHPLTWLSFMLDYRLYGENAGGYHTTNVILHLFSTLLLFWLFCRMTSAIWPSAFAAALFALHPMHVESVAWITKRKDVLSAFFWMLTLCLYVYYTEKPNVKRYLPVVFSFVCALMSKPMVVTLPVIMILLDYWPLMRFEQMKGNRILWQIKEKLPFFVLSAVISLITMNVHGNPLITHYSPGSRIANALVAFVTYLEKMIWPRDFAVYYPFINHFSFWLVFACALLIIVISIAVVTLRKSLPSLFVGWLWYAITILPVIGIIQINSQAISYHYTYLPSIGIGICLAWGIPLLFPREDTRKYILFPAAAAIIIVISLMTWQQCRYWKNSFSLLSHTLSITKDNYLAHNNIANYLAEEGKTDDALHHYNEAIRINPDCAETYNNRGNVYGILGRYELAIDNYSAAIRLKQDYAGAYSNRGNLYTRMGRRQDALKDFNESIRLNPSSTSVYNNRGTLYFQLGRYAFAMDDFNKAISLDKNCFEAYYNKACVFAYLKQYQAALENYHQAVTLKPDNSEVYKSAGDIYFKQKDPAQGCRFARKACELGDCKLLDSAMKNGYCPATN